MNNKHIGIIVLALGVIAIGGVIYASGQSSTTPVATQQTTPSQTTKTTEPRTVSSADTSTAEPTYTLAEVAKHDSAEDCWMVIDGAVLDVTDYIASGQHVPEIADGCGLDATEMFDAERHHRSPKAQRLLPEFTIGMLQ
jgi:cytochrome b involved in lipid metabolism